MKTGARPEVSVVIPTCDRPYLLKNAIKSVLRQDFKSIEVIVVNDGCEPLSISSSDERLVLIDLKPSSRELYGFAAGGHSRNVGIERARGRFVAFLDDDDQFLPNKVSRTLSELEMHGARHACTDGFIGVLPWFFPVLSSRFGEYYKDIYRERLNKLGLASLPQFIRSPVIEAHNFVITSSVVVEKELLESESGFNIIPIGGRKKADGYAEFEDWDLWKRMICRHPMLYIDEPLIYYKRGSMKKLRRKFHRFLTTTR